MGKGWSDWPACLGYDEVSVVEGDRLNLDKAIVLADFWDGDRLLELEVVEAARSSNEPRGRCLGNRHFEHVFQLVE